MILQNGKSQFYKVSQIITRINQFIDFVYLQQGIDRHTFAVYSIKNSYIMTPKINKFTLEVLHKCVLPMLNNFGQQPPPTHLRIVSSKIKWLKHC